MGETQLLERITLDRQAISFNRMYTTSAVYYHWHQCVELLYISSGYGIVVVDNQHYTARPGRLFVFPPFRLHKVQVDHSDKNPYHRTTMHIAQSVVESALSTFPRHQARFAALAASNLPAQIYDLSTHAAFIERILEQFQHLEDNAQTEACEVAFLVMQLMTCLPEQPQPYPPRQQTGGSIHEYLLTRRIKSSCDLLRYSDEPVDAIALAVGFSEVTYFITCFKKMMRQTPLQYRRSNSGTRIPG